MLDEYHQRYLLALTNHHDVLDVTCRCYAGHHFLYVDCPLPWEHVAQILREAGVTIVGGTKLTLACIYVRSAQDTHVFRIRLLVPQQKHFCCGNLCQNCILLS